MPETRDSYLQSAVLDAFKSKIIRCLRNALEDDLRDFTQSTNLVTHNGLAFLKGDYINTRLQNEIASDTIQVVPFTRYGWESRLIIDHGNKIAYNVISKSRFEQLIKNAKDGAVPHYSLLFSYSLNGDLEAPTKQMSFFEDYPYSDDIMTDGFKKLVGGQLQPSSEYRYCIITYEVCDGQLVTSEIVLPDKDLDIVESLSLNDYILPDYSQLTQNDNNENCGEEPRVKLKKRSTSENSLVLLKAEDKRA